LGIDCVRQEVVKVAMPTLSWFILVSVLVVAWRYSSLQQLAPISRSRHMAYAE
jgi:hypothetical protein